MNKKNFFEEGGIYVAPEMEVISVAAECGGINVSSGDIDDSDIVNGGEW